MDEVGSIAEAACGREMSVIDTMCSISEKHRENSGKKFRPSDADYWKTVQSAKTEGKKLIFVSGPLPMELIYAMDCVPLCLDLIPARLSENPELTAKFIGETDRRVDQDFCALNRAEIGAMISGKLGVAPDAYVSVPIPCDSARTAYFVMSRFAEAPAFNFDIPMRINDRSLGYVATQLESFLDFLENVTGEKLDWNKLKYRMELSNRAGELLNECARLRKNRPCPMSSHMAVWNELMNAMSPTEPMLKQLEEELRICRARAAKGESPCPTGEKHRVLLLQNLFWQGIDITDWLETEFGAVTVADGFFLRTRDFFGELDDREACLELMCRRMLTGSSVHGAAVSAFELSDMASGAVREYGADVSIFLGNAGCRHSWAAEKLVTDSITDTFGIPTLSVDVDNTDRRYKSEKDIKMAISEYMDAVVNNQK